jgi:hypothetical protein
MVFKNNITSFTGGSNPPKTRFLEVPYSNDLILFKPLQLPLQFPFSGDAPGQGLDGCHGLQMGGPGS